MELPVMWVCSKAAALAACVVSLNLNCISAYAIAFSLVERKITENGLYSCDLIEPNSKRFFRFLTSFRLDLLLLDDFDLIVFFFSRCVACAFCWSHSNNKKKKTIQIVWYPMIMPTRWRPSQTYITFLFLFPLACGFSRLQVNSEIAIAWSKPEMRNNWFQRALNMHAVWISCMSFGLNWHLCDFSRNLHTTMSLDASFRCDTMRCERRLCCTLCALTMWILHIIFPNRNLLFYLECTNLFTACFITVNICPSRKSVWNSIYSFPLRKMSSAQIIIRIYCSFF